MCHVYKSDVFYQPPIVFLISTKYAVGRSVLRVITQLSQYLGYNFVTSSNNTVMLWLGSLAIYRCADQATTYFVLIKPYTILEVKKKSLVYL